ncbi:MAG: ESX secretion-associated protein EspG [Anaerolineae bacterium]
MVDIPPLTQFVCYPEELFTLASMLGGETLIGVPDPFPGWLTEEIEAAVEKARQSLIGRGYLKEQDGALHMDVLVAALVATVAEPEAAVILTVHQPPHKPQWEAFYWRSPLIVTLHPENDRYTLASLPSSQDALSLILKVWGVDAQKPAPGGAFAVLQKVLDATREALKQGEREAIRVLHRSGVESGSARAFVRTLRAGVRNGALSAFRPLETTWQVGGIGMLEGENGLWRLRPFQRQNAEWVECIPCSASELTEEIRSLLEQFLPIED